MSDVPLPEPPSDDPLRYVEGYDADALRSYGDARAAESRRLALLEAIALVEQRFQKYYGDMEGAGAIEFAQAEWAAGAMADLGKRLRALADEASPKQVSG